jgi:hypothetical protein
MRLRRIGWVIVAVAVVAVVDVRGQELDTKEARGAVDRWLSLVDHEQFSESWQTAASMFRDAVNEPTWTTAVQSARGRMGAVKDRTRTLRSATATRTAPGAPDGEYVIYVFDTSFDNKAAGVETVTAMRDRDRAWRVAGYFVR